MQTATVLVLGPILEADLVPEQHAYRAGRSAHDVIRRVHGLARRGHTEVVEADLAGYFDSIAHAELMRSVARRISDRHVLALNRCCRSAPCLLVATLVQVSVGGAFAESEKALVTPKVPDPVALTADWGLYFQSAGDDRE